MPLIAKKKSKPTMSLLPRTIQYNTSQNQKNQKLLSLPIQPQPQPQLQPQPEINTSINFRNMRENLQGKRRGCSACRGTF